MKNEFNKITAIVDFKTVINWKKVKLKKVWECKTLLQVNNSEPPLRNANRGDNKNRSASKIILMITPKFVNNTKQIINKKSLNY